MYTSKCTLGLSNKDKEIIVNVSRDAQGIVDVKGGHGNDRNLTPEGGVEISDRKLHLQIVQKGVQEGNVGSLHLGGFDAELPPLVRDHVQGRGGDDRPLQGHWNPGQHSHLEVHLADEGLGGDDLADPSDPGSRCGLRVEGESVLGHLLVVLPRSQPDRLEKGTGTKELRARIAQVPFSAAVGGRVLGGIQGLELGHEVNDNVLFLPGAVGPTVRDAGQEEQFSLEVVADRDVFVPLVDRDFLGRRWQVARVVVRRRAIVGVVVQNDP